MVCKDKPNKINRDRLWRESWWRRIPGTGTEVREVWRKGYINARTNRAAIYPAYPSS